MWKDKAPHSHNTILKSLLAGRFPYRLWPLTSLSLRRFNRVLHDGCHTKHILHHTLQCVLYVCLLQTQLQTVTSNFSSGENHCRHFTQLCQTPPPKKKKTQKNKPLWNSSIIIVETQPTRLPLGCIRWSSSSKKYKFNLACVCLCIVYILCKYKVSEHKDKAGIYASICPDAYGAGFQLLVLHWRPDGTLPSLLCITGVFLHQAT